MKKLLSIIAVAALSTAFVACGPSKDELAKAEQRITDSTRSADSIAAAATVAAEAEAAASAAAAEVARVADSTRVADSLAKGGKKGKK